MSTFLFSDVVAPPVPPLVQRTVALWARLWLCVWCLPLPPLRSWRSKALEACLPDIRECQTAFLKVIVSENAKRPEVWLSEACWGKASRRRRYFMVITLRLRWCQNSGVKSQILAVELCKDESLLFGGHLPLDDLGGPPWTLPVKSETKRTLWITLSDGPISANRFADSRGSPHSGESVLVPELNSIFGESSFGAWKVANRRFEAIHANRSHRANRLDSRCESPGHLRSRFFFRKTFRKIC